MPIPKQPKPPRFEVDHISFNLKLIKALIPIKFKCRFLVEIKTSSSTSFLKTLAKSKDHYRQIASLITFDKDQTLPFTHYMVFDNELNRYKKTEIQIVVSLISDSRGDEVKLVGRIRVDLNEFMIDNRGETLLKEQELENCSVKKPEVAKLTYELSLVKEEKMNIAQNVDKEAIYVEIDRGVFADALEYNQFGKEIFGKDFSILNASKLNRSLNQSVNKGSNISREGTEWQKKQSIDKTEIEAKSIKQIQNPSAKGTIEDKNPTKEFSKVQQSNDKILLNKPKLVKSLVDKKSQASDKKVENKVQEPQQTSTQEKLMQLAKKSSVVEQQIQPITSSKRIPPKSQSSTKSPSKVVISSPRQKVTQPVSQQITQAEPSSQPKQQNFLTQSMFDEQELIIQSLQEQLQEANQMIEQYRLEMELLKEQTQRLQNEKSMHATQLQTSRLRNKSSSNLMIQPISTQQHQLQQQVHTLNLTIEQYKKLFRQKQEIIQQKDHIIVSLQGEIQAAAHDMVQQLNQKDMALHELEKEFTLVVQENNQMKGEINKMIQEINKQGLDAHVMEGVIQQLKNQVEELNAMVKNSGVSELKLQLEQKDKQIKQIKDLLELEKTNTTELQFKISSLQSTIYSLNTSNNQQIFKIVIAQQAARKNQQAKEKAEAQLSKAIQKSKAFQKEKYQLTQEITSNKANQKSIDKLVQQKVKQYKQQYDQLALTYQQAQNKIAQLKFAVQSYQSTLQSEQTKSQQQIKQLTAKLQNFNKKEHLLRQSLDLLENQTTKIRNFVEEKETRIREYEELVFMKDEELNDKNDKLNFMERKQRMNENAINDLKLQLKMANAMNLQSQDDRQFGSEQELETRLFVLNQANMQLLQKQKLLTETIDEKEQTIHELQKLTSTIDPLKRQVASLEHKLLTSEEKYREVKDELKALNKKDLEQRKKLQQQSSELENVFSQYELLQEQLNLLQEEKLSLFSMVQEYKSKDHEIMNLEQEQREKQKKIKELELQIVRKNEDLTNLRKQHDQIERLNQELNHKLSLVQNSNYTENSKKQDLLIQSRKASNDKDKDPFSAIKQLSKDYLPSPQHTRSRQEQEIYRLTEELQAYKQREESYMCNVLDLQQQLEIVKKEKSSLSSSIHEQKQTRHKTQSIQPVGLYDKKDLKVACDQLEKLIEQRIRNRDTENLIQMIVSNSQMLGSESRVTTEEGTLFARQKNSLQEKSRILSREVQKIKSLIFKNSEFSYKSKTQIIQLLKPCESITSELIKIAENFSKENDQENYSEA